MKLISKKINNFKRSMFLMSVFMSGAWYGVDAQGYDFQLVKDLNSGSSNSNPKEITVVGNQLFFVADMNNGQQTRPYLWKSDGTTSGTELVQSNFSEIYTPENLVSHGGWLYFSAADEFDGKEPWKSNGNPNGTLPFKNINTADYQGSNPKDFTVFNNLIYFAANNGVVGNELWLSDGTSAGTALLKDIRTGANSSNPQNFYPFNGKLYFEANDGDSGFELWVTDGTSSGTLKVKEIGDGNSDAQIEYLTEFNGKLYFSAWSLSTGNELWVTDGTTSGTQLVKDINPTGGSHPSYLTVFNGALYFTARTGSETLLWKTDGTETGTVLAWDPNMEVLGIEDLIVYNGHLYFSSKNELEEYELYKSDGTNNGTSRLKDIRVGLDGSHPKDFYIYNGKLYFTAIDGSNGRELWVTDGSESGTVKIAPDIATGNNPLGEDPNFKTFNGSLYFAAGFDGNGVELWKLTTENMSTQDVVSRPFSTVFPNPVKNHLTIDLDKIKSSHIQLFDLQGKLIKEAVIETKGKLDVSTIPAGIYILKIEATGETKKIIKR